MRKAKSKLWKSKATLRQRLLTLMPSSGCFCSSLSSFARRLTVAPDGPAAACRTEAVLKIPGFSTRYRYAGQRDACQRVKDGVESPRSSIGEHRGYGNCPPATCSQYGHGKSAKSFAKGFAQSLAYTSRLQQARSTAAGATSLCFALDLN